VAGYWQAPRALARMVAERELSLSAYALLNFIGQSGADRPEGFATTNEFLASALGVSDSTIRRALRALRDERLIEYVDHERVAVFTVRDGDRLRSLLRSPLRSPEMPAVTAEPAVTAATATGRDPASEEGSAAVTPADTSRARAETETETETTTANAVVRHGGEVIDPDEVLLARVRAHRPDAGGIVAAIMDALTALAGEPLFPRAEYKIVGRHAKELLAQGQPRERVATAGLIALLRRSPELTQRLCGDLAAHKAHAILAREEWQAYVNASVDTGPLQAIHDRRVALSRVIPAPAAQPACPECGIGGGRHAADCPTIPKEEGDGAE
jgi:DNA-binding transcriptional ArsR family regulator